MIVDDAAHSSGPVPANDLPMVSLIIPTYNEESHIQQTLVSVTDYLHTIEDRFRWELIIVDDGSTDATRSVAHEFAHEKPNVRIAAQPTNFKLGQALRYGFSLSKGDYIVTLDADMSYSPDHIGRLLDVITSTEAKIVIASPYAENGEVTNVPTTRLAASRAANKLLSMAAKGDLTTITGMVRAYDAMFLRGLNLKAMDVEINAEIIYKAQLLRGRILEIPAHLEWTREKQDARVAGFAPTRSIAAFAFVSFLFRPYAFFLIPGAITAIVAVGFWIGVLIQELRGGATVSIVITSAMFTILTAILVGMGVLSAQAKRYFEELFHLGTSTLRAERRDSDRA